MILWKICTFWQNRVHFQWRIEQKPFLWKKGQNEVWMNVFLHNFWRPRRVQHHMGRNSYRWISSGGLWVAVSVRRSPKAQVNQPHIYLVSFHRCQKHISAISTMSKAYWVQWRVRVSCFKTLCPGMEGLVWHSATTQSACGEISSLKLHPPRFLVAGTVFSTLMVTIVFVQLAIKYSHITSPKSTTKSQTMLARGATII